MVDIIIPIYNAYDDLKKCVNSVIKHTDLQSNRLILVDDNSSDDRIMPYIGSIANNNIVVVHNSTNKGFSGSVNYGMEQSKVNDVILLNSDTIVTERWLEKMVKCAYSNGGIATVTPLSNNATLCSVPVPFKTNELPNNLTIDDVAEVVERCSMHDYPKISVANGFCMFIKRQVIETVGFFDEKTFERGYGEENDFCCRADEMGYYHVMCDDTYIYHSGSKSFISKEKIELMQKHEAILRDRYPVQMHNNDVYCAENPNKYIAENIEEYLTLKNGKKNILEYLHYGFKLGSKDSIGGTQLHVRSLIENLREKYNFFVVSRNECFLQLNVYTDQKEYSHSLYIGDASAFRQISDRKIYSAVHNILCGFDINLVHVHHTRSTSLDIFEASSQLGIPIVSSIHDYYYLCPRITPIDFEGKICIDDNETSCDECINRMCGVYGVDNYVEKWRYLNKQALEKSKVVVTPSNSTKDYIEKAFPTLHDRITVIPHGMDKKEAYGKIPSDLQPCQRGNNSLQIRENRHYIEIIGRVDKKNDKYFLAIRSTELLPIYIEKDGTFRTKIPMELLKDVRKIQLLAYSDKGEYHIADEVDAEGEYNTKRNRTRVAVIGAMSPEKGVDLFARLVEGTRETIEWYLFGESSLPIESFIECHHIGAYNQEDIWKLLAFYEIEAVALLSKTPETYSYTLSEAMLSGLPIIATDIGAFPERLKHYYNSQLISKNASVKEFLEAFERLDVKNQNSITADNKPIPSIAEMSECYAKIYEKYMGHNKYGDCDRRILYFSRYPGYSKENDQMMNNIRESYEQRISNIYNSWAWRIGTKVKSMIPVWAFSILKQRIEDI